jgi:Fis family transcriptional regulator
MSGALHKKVTRITEHTAAAGRGHHPLYACVKTLLDGYFQDLDGHKAGNLYDLVLDEVEVPLLEVVLRHTRGNQSRAAEILGLNRATLRKKLRKHGLD